MPPTASKTTTGVWPLPKAVDLKVAHWVALGGIRAGGPLPSAAARPLRRGAGCLGWFPNLPGGQSVGVNPIRRQF